MKKILKTLSFSMIAIAVAAAFSLVPAAQGQQSYAITGAKVYPVSGPPIDGATVVIRGGKITAVGKGAAIPSGAKVIDAKGLEVYPGMFNAVTEIGMNEVGAVEATVDTAELGEYN
ncbi:MAG TPA: hypothetical protein VN774_01465, partial [Candidatus Limnocylindrales bacterium]|nr:hypothetical protein [Candidatus Limnocylindrales bacterium]